MKKILFFVLLFSTLSFAQTPTMVASFDLLQTPGRTVTTSDPFNIANRSISNHVFTWSVQQGSLTSCTLSFETAVASTGPWTQQATGNCTTNGTSGNINFAANWFRVNTVSWVPNIQPTRVTINWAGSTTVLSSIASFSPVNLTNINAIRQCLNYAGATADIKIEACIADLPSTGGTADARGLDGAQTISSNIFSGITKPVTLLLSPTSTYTATVRQNISSSSIHVRGNGATWIFNPTGPIVPGTNDRPFAVIGVLGSALNGSGSIALGASSFTAANSSDAATLNPNDWLIIQEKDTPRGDDYYYDQVQVSSVSMTTVNIYGKFRTAFPGTHSTFTYTKINTQVNDVVVSDLNITSNWNSTGVVGITVGAGARSTIIDNLVINMTAGAAITTYQTEDTKIINSTFRSGASITSEFSACVDCIVSKNIFDFFNVTPATIAVTMDFGSGFSIFSNNTIVKAGNIGVGFWYGVHNCVIQGNTIGWVLNAGIGVGNGLTGIGAYNNTITGNILIGGDTGSGNTGISFSTDTTASPNVTTTGNVIVGNTLTNFSTSYFGTPPYPSGDSYIQYSGENQTMGRSITLTHATNPFIQGNKTNATAQQYAINFGDTFSINDATNSITDLSFAKATGALTITGPATFNSTLAAGASNQITLTSNEIDMAGQPAINHAAITSCTGGGCTVASGSVLTNSVGRFTTTTTGTMTVTIAFSITWGHIPSCMAQNEGHGPAVQTIPSTTQVILTGTTTSGDVISYICISE